MADLIQGGVIKVGFDGSDVEVGTQKAQRSVGDLGKAAESAGVQGAKGIDKLSDASKKAADTIDKAAQRESLAIQRRTAATLAGSASNAEFYRLIQQHKNVNLLPEQAIAQLAAAERLVQKNILAEKQLAAAEADRANQLKKLIDVERERLAAAAQQRTSASALIKGYEGATKAQDNHYRSTKQLNQALRGVPAQFTDIVVSLQGGQKPLQVLLQQGGQLKDLFGTTGQAARALGGYVLGLINPYTLVAGAVTALGAAYFYGSEESTRLSKALIASGNIAGGTVSQFNAIAKQVGQTTGHFGDAREAIQALAAGGVVSAGNIETALKGVVAGAQLTGRSVQDVAKDFEAIAKEPVKALLKLNETQNFLTIEVYKQIAALEKQGKQQEAATLAIDTYANTLKNRTGDVVENLGIIETAWKNIKRSASSAIDGILEIGRPLTNTQKLDEATKKLEKLYQIRSTTAGGAFERVGSDAQIAAAIDEVKKINAAVFKENEIARTKNAEAIKNKQRVENAANLDNFLNSTTHLSKSEQLAANIKKVKDDFNKAVAGFVTDADKKTKEYIAAVKKRDHDIAIIEADAAAPSIRKSEQARERAARERAAAEKRRLADIEREQAKFTNFGDSLKEKIAGANEQIRLDAKLTESQRLRIQLNTLHAKSTLANKDAIKESLLVDIAKLDISEQIIKSEQLRDKLNQFNAQGNAQLKEKADALAIEYALYGKTNEARDIAIIGLKAQAEAEKELVRLKDAGFDVSEQQVAQLKAESQARAANEQAILGESQALAFASQLREKNKQFELDSIFDAKDRAAAEIKLEDEMWQERIKLAGNGTDAQKKLIDELAQYQKNRLNKPLIDEWKKTVETYDKIFRDGFAGLLNGGKKSFSAWTKSLVTTFKTSVADQIYNLLARPFVVKLVASLLGVGGVAGSGNALASAATVLGSSGDSIQASIFKGLSGIQGSITGGIEKLGAFLTNGNGGLLDKIGGFLGTNAGAIGNALPFAGAALQALTGNLKGAAFTAAGAAIGSFIPGIGTAIGGAIGNLVGGLFGGNSKGHRAGANVGSTFANGVFSNGYVTKGTATKFNAAYVQPLQDISKAFATQLGGLLSAFNLDDSLSLSAEFKAKQKGGKGNTKANFVVSGDGFSFYDVFDFKQSDTQSFQKYVDSVLGTTLVKAIQSSKLSDGIKSLFDGLADKEQIQKFIGATVSLANAQKGLADKFGLTTDQAAKVSKATGLVGDALADFVSKLSITASGQSATELLTSARDKLVQVLGSGLPATLSGFDNIIKTIDKSNAEGINRVVELLGIRAGFEEYTNALDNLKGGVKQSLLSIVSDTEKQQIIQADLAKAFGELGLAVPGSIEELITLGKTIDFTTKAGLDLASVFPSLVTAFENTQEAAKKVVDNLRDVNSFKTDIDFQRYSSVANNYGTRFANNYVDGINQNVAAQNFTTTPNLNTINPTNNTTVSYSDTNLLAAVQGLTAKVEALQLAADQTARYTKRAADILVEVSPNGDSIQTKAVV